MLTVFLSRGKKPFQMAELNDVDLKKKSFYFQVWLLDVF